MVAANATLKELRESGAEIDRQIRSHADTHFYAEATGKPAKTWNAEGRQTWDRLNSERDEIDKRIKAMEEAEVGERAVAERLQRIADLERTPGTRVSADQVHEIALRGEQCMEEAFRTWAYMGRDRHRRHISEPMARSFEAYRSHVYALYDRGASVGDVDRENFCVVLGGGYGLGRQVSGIQMARSALDFNMRQAAEFARRHGMPLAEARAAMGVSVDTLGGYLVPEGFVYELEHALRAYGGIRERATVRRTETANPLPMPTIADTNPGSVDPIYGGALINVGELLGENQATSLIGTPPTMGALILGAQKFSTKLIQISHELTRDSAFNMGTEMGRIGGERLGRIMAQKWATGSGSGVVPRGIALDAVVSYAAANANQFTFDDLTNFLYTLDPAYREMDGSCWLLHDQMIKNLRLIKDGLGRYIWQSSNVTLQGDVKGGEPERLLDKPVQRVQELPYDFSGDCIDGTTQPTLILFGTVPKYQIREVQQMRFRRLVERFAEYDQEGYIGFMEADGGLLDAGTRPVKALGNHDATLGARFVAPKRPVADPRAGEMADTRDELRGLDESNAPRRQLSDAQRAEVLAMLQEANADMRNGNGGRAAKKAKEAEKLATDAVENGGGE